MATKWELIGYVIRSENRQKALKILYEPTTPSMLAENMKMSLTHASKVIRELYNKGLIDCKNDKMKVGRIYQINSKGKTILKNVK